MGVSFSHLGYRPDDIAGLNRTQEGHGGLEPTGEVVSGLTIVRCPNCGWRGKYVRLEPITAIERIRSLEARNMQLEGDINRQLTPDRATGFQKPGALSLTAADRREYERNQREIERLKTLSAWTQVDVKFVGTHSGSLIASWTPDAEPVPAHVVQEESQKDLTPRQVMARQQASERMKKLRDERRRKKELAKQAVIS